jgi:hypothetical protein
LLKEQITMTMYNVAPEFDDAGIKPLVHGIPELPKAAQSSALARKIKREGIRAHDGTQIAEFDDTGAAMLAWPWAYPAQIAGQLAAPQAVTVQAGTLYYVTGLVLTTRVMPPYHNSRARSKLAIPSIDAHGRVNFPWPTRDVQPDPTDGHRLLITAPDLGGLAAAAHATADHVESMQGRLKDDLAREGVEEQILIVPARFELISGTLADNLAWLASDGGSRVTIEQGFLADAIDAMLQSGAKMSPKRRAGLRDLGVHLRGRVAGLLGRDTVAERDLRDELERLLYEPAGDLVKSRLYAAQRALVLPARALVAFRPHAGGTVLDATQQLIGNAHKRGPKQWDSAATAVDTRDEVLRKLDEGGSLSEDEKYLYGPAYEEAYTRLGISDHPDYRIGELVRFFHEQDPLNGDVRRAMREVLRVGRLMPSARGQVIAGAILEQVRDADQKRRDNIESALNELLAHPPFFNTGVWWPSRDPDVDELLNDVANDQTTSSTDWTPAKVELAVKGGLALATLGALWRIYGDTDAEQRVYNVLPRIAHDPYGQELLGEAIRAVRAGKDHIQAIDPETRKPVFMGNGDPKPMDPQNLRDLFPSTTKTVKKAQPTEDELVRSIVDNLKNGVSNDLTELEDLLVVQQRGVTPSPEVQEALELLEDYRDRLKFLVRQHRNYYTGGGDQTGGGDAISGTPADDGAMPDSSGGAEE